MNNRDDCCSSIRVRDVRVPAEVQACECKATEAVYRPPMDLHEWTDRYELTLDVPGAGGEDIEVTLEDNVLLVEARVTPRDETPGEPLLREFGVGGFRRRVRLGEDIDTERLNATYDDGVLRLTLPKVRRRLPRRVPINAN